MVPPSQMLLGSLKAWGTLVAPVHKATYGMKIWETLLVFCVMFQFEDLDALLQVCGRTPHRRPADASITT